MKELFYSNGVDVFGPVSIEEFSKNKYYKSTMIWYEGLAGWVSIEACDDLKHLIGTMSTPVLDSVPQSLPDLTPPLTSKENITPGVNRKYLVVAIVLVLILISLIVYYFNQDNTPSTNVMAPISQDTILVKDTAVLDSITLRHNEILKKAQLETEAKTYRMNWEKFISAFPNDFKRKDMGGIEDLKINVKNHTPYKIDLMEVKVVYLKANSDQYHTEIISFENVDPDGIKELFAPSSDRGVKVVCNILSLTSKAMNMCLDKKAKGFSKLKGEDPYRCERTPEM